MKKLIVKSKSNNWKRNVIFRNLAWLCRYKASNMPAWTTFSGESEDSNTRIWLK